MTPYRQLAEARRRLSQQQGSHPDPPEGLQLVLESIEILRHRTDYPGAFDDALVRLEAYVAHVRCMRERVRRSP